MRIAAIAGAAALALVIGGSSLASTHRQTASRCRTGALVVWMDTEGNGAAGSVFYNLQITNLSRHKCTLFGYPGVSAVDLHGHQLGRAATRLNAHPHQVTLRKGATAKATLQIVEALNFPRSRCHPGDGGGLARLPAEHEGLENRSVSVPRVLPPRARLPERQAGARLTL